MADADSQILESVAQAYQELINKQQTLILSTYSSEHGAEVSYAPYVKGESGLYYIYTSELAPHTRNLISQGQASVLFIGDEADAATPFARERVTFNCQVKEIPMDDERYDSMLTNMHSKFGQVVTVLRSLPDFHLFVLMPQSGQYVVGFGKAFTIDPATGTVRQRSN